MSASVHIEHFSPRRALAFRRSVTVPAFQELIPQALELLREHARKTDTCLCGDPLCIYHGPVNQQDDGPVEICWPIRDQGKPGLEIEVRELPEHTAAVGTADPEHSRFPEILEIWDEVLHWVQQEGLTIREDLVPCYEIWHEDGSISVVQPFLKADRFPQP